MAKHDPPLAFPVRGVAGGWRDVWDDPQAHQPREHERTRHGELGCGTLVARPGTRPVEGKERLGRGVGAVSPKTL